MRFVALDLGERRVGVATGDTVIRIAFPQTPIDFGKAGKVDAARLAQLCEKLGADTLVIGLPLDAEGKETPQCAFVREIAEKLSAQTGLPTIFRNEALSTVRAEEVLRAHGVRGKRLTEAADSLAAANMLQELLDEWGSE